MESRSGPLKEHETNLLHRYWRTLKQDIRMSDVVDVLIEKGVIRPEAWNEIKKSSNIERNQTEEFLLWLLKKPSRNFIIFREALRDHGYPHLAEKLEIHEETHSSLKTQQNHQGAVKDESEAGQVTDVTTLERQIKDLYERDNAKEKQINLNRKELEIKIKKQNNELDKMKVALQQKEEEINCLKKCQSQQEETNQHLLHENTKLELEKEQMIEEIDNQKTKEKKISREREKLKKTIERQNTRIEELKKENTTAMENLQRERTCIGDLQREKTNLIEQLEGERALTARSGESSFTPREIGRRPPTGISDDITDINDETESSDYEELIRQADEAIKEMKKSIKETEEKRKKDIEKWNALNPGADVRNSQLCVVQ